MLKLTVVNDVDLGPLRLLLKEVAIVPEGLNVLLRRAVILKDGRVLIEIFVGELDVAAVDVLPIRSMALISLVSGLYRASKVLVLK